MSGILSRSARLASHSVSHYRITVRSVTAWCWTQIWVSCSSVYKHGRELSKKCSQLHMYLQTSIWSTHTYWRTLTLTSYHGTYQRAFEQPPGLSCSPTFQMQVNDLWKTLATFLALNWYMCSSSRAWKCCFFELTINSTPKINGKKLCWAGGKFKQSQVWEPIKLLKHKVTLRLRSPKHDLFVSTVTLLLDSWSSHIKWLGPSASISML